MPIDSERLNETECKLLLNLLSDNNRKMGRSKFKDRLREKLLALLDAAKERGA